MAYHQLPGIFLCCICGMGEGGYVGGVKAGYGGGVRGDKAMSNSSNRMLTPELKIRDSENLTLLTEY